MKFIENSVSEYQQLYTEIGLWTAVRDAAVICYQNSPDMVKKSPKDFVMDVLVKNGHTRPLEFGSVYLKMPINKRERYIDNKYSRLWIVDDTTVYVSTNLRVLMQGYYHTDKEAWEHGYDKNWLDDLQYLCPPTEYHFLRRTFTMNISRGCSDDFRTHVELSSICESTRWCNYSNDKFNGELTFIWPYWFTKLNMDEVNAKGIWGPNAITIDSKDPEGQCLLQLQKSEISYLSLVSKDKGLGLQAQQGKRVFPLGAKAELRLCGFDEAWQNFFWRRCDAQHADPECVKVANMIHELYNNNKN